MQVLGDFIQRGAVEPLLVKEPGTGLVERFLLGAVLLRPVEAFQRGLAILLQVHRRGAVLVTAGVEAVHEDIDGLVGDLRQLLGCHPVQPGEGPVHGAQQRPGRGGGFQRPKAAIGNAVAQVLAQAFEQGHVLGLHFLAVAAPQGSDLQQGGDVGAAPLAGRQPVVEVLHEERAQACARGGVLPVDFVQVALVVGQGRQVALVDQLFLGFDVVVEAGLGQPQVLGNVLQGGGAGALVIEQTGGLGQDGQALGVVLHGAVEGRSGTAGGGTCVVGHTCNSSKRGRGPVTVGGLKPTLNSKIQTLSIIFVAVYSGGGPQPLARAVAVE